MKIVIVLAVLVLCAWKWSTLVPCQVTVIARHEQTGKACPDNEVMVGGVSLSPAKVLCAKVQVSCE